MAGQYLEGSPTGPVLSPALQRRLQNRVLDWYISTRRSLPWREGNDPYAVWVSEMMLQQTQVGTVIPYFTRWMIRFPSITKLAAARTSDVLKAWEGLGYYARARNLHRAAQVVMERHAGRLPADYPALLALPGIGPYSAGAIASIAFNLPTPAVDGNVGRVLSRIFALEEPAGSTTGKKNLERLAKRLIPRGRARDFNQGLMELGALVCRAREPACALCPVRADCQAHARGQTAAYPRPQRRPQRKPVRAVMALMGSHRGLLLRHRPDRGLWGGLWEFPWEEIGGEETAENAVERLLVQVGMQGSVPQQSAGSVRHGLTHRIFAWQCLWGWVADPDGAPGEQSIGGCSYRWVQPADLLHLPMSLPARKAGRLIHSVAPSMDMPILTET